MIEKIQIVVKIHLSRSNDKAKIHHQNIFVSYLATLSFQSGFSHIFSNPLDFSFSLKFFSILIFGYFFLFSVRFVIKRIHSAWKIPEYQ